VDEVLELGKRRDQIRNPLIFPHFLIYNMSWSYFSIS
jgi:hypothetical protein